MRLSLARGVRRFLNSPHHHQDMDKHPSAYQKFFRKEETYYKTGWEWSIYRSCKFAAIRRMDDNDLRETTKADDAQMLAEHHARERVKAAVEELDGDMSQFVRYLNKSRLGLDAQALAQLAIWEPRSFAAVVSLTKQLAVEGGEIIGARHPPTNVHTGHLGQQEPLPKGKAHNIGRRQSWQTPPRELHPDEF